MNKLAYYFLTKEATAKLAGPIGTGGEIAPKSWNVRSGDEVSGRHQPAWGERAQISKRLSMVPGADRATKPPVNVGKLLNERSRRQESKAKRLGISSHQFRTDDNRSPRGKREVAEILAQDWEEPVVYRSPRVAKIDTRKARDLARWRKWKEGGGTGPRR